MTLLSDLTPTNFAAEKARFLADPTFNPQFQYQRQFSFAELTTYGLPKPTYLEHAHRILDAMMARFTPQQLQEQRGRLLTTDEVSFAFLDFLDIHGLRQHFQIVWSSEFVSRASVTADNIIKLRSPNRVREHDLTSLIYHELGTHVLRRINYQQQPWFRKKKRYGFAPYLTTEEGLGAVHASLPKADYSDQTLKNVANYLAVEIAQQGSFLEVWQFVSQYLQDPDTAFTISFRQKRGIADTSQPGGYTKDLVYFEGFVDVIRFLIARDFPLKELYFGKLALEDMERAVQLNPDFEPLLPSFFTNDRLGYQERVTEIARLHDLV